MDSQWLIIGVSGVTCGGKTTVVREIKELLPGIKIISQDNYFYPKESDKHVLIPELNHFNWDILTSLDMGKMFSDIKTLVGDEIMKLNVTDVLDEFNRSNYKCFENKTQVFKNDVHLIRNKLAKYNINILLIEGFSIFNYEPIDQICHFKFFLTLTREICYARRNKRTYDPPDVPGYFEQCVWPEYTRHLKEVQDKSKNVIYYSEEDTNKCACVFNYIIFFFQKLT